MSLSKTAINKTEEIEEKWRLQMNNKGESPNGVVSPHPEQQQKTERLLSRRGEFPIEKMSTGNTKIYKNFYVTLAKESPKRINEDEISDSTYDSFHCRETDVCRDSTDEDSNSSCTSDGVATMEVLEYEVASASATEDLYSNDSSSGTDDILLAAVASALCPSSSCSSDFADTEQDDSSESNNTYDSELSSADYWVCVKCKNRQNNPMFRYCERCYQIRKTHFPPRPRLRKSRSLMKRKSSRSFRSTSLRSSVTSPAENFLQLNDYQQQKEEQQHSDDEIFKRLGNMPPANFSCLNALKSKFRQNCDKNGKNNNFKKRRLSYINSNTNQLNSAAETSSDDSSDIVQHNYFKDDNEEKFNLKNFGKRLRSTTYSTNQSSADIINKPLINNLRSSSPEIPNIGRKRKLLNDGQPSDIVSKKLCNKLPPCNSIFSDFETDLVIDHLNTINFQKDSGFSSAPSSQDICEPSVSKKKCIDKAHNDGDSSDTVCDELDDKEIAELSKQNMLEADYNITANSIPLLQADGEKALLLCKYNRSESLGRHISELPPTSEREPQSVSDVVRSVSACSDAYTNTIASNDSELFLSSNLKGINNNINRSTEQIDNSGYGSCMTCLSEPKNGVFVHSRFLHLCCCYKCAVKIWNKNKKCPICNCAVKNVMKLFVH